VQFQAGMFHTAYSYNTPHHIELVFNKSDIIRLQFLPFFWRVLTFLGIFPSRNDLTASLKCHYIVHLQYMSYWRRIGDVLGDFGANQVHFVSKNCCVQKLALPSLLSNTIVLYAYFIVLNVPNDCMKHPWF